MIKNQQCYTFYLNSNDKISGSNNNATFYIDWKNYLPENYEKYNIRFTFCTVFGVYSFLSGRILIDFFGRNYSFETGNLTPSICLGMFNNYSTSLDDNITKTIARPRDNIINIKFLDINDNYITITDYDDMGEWCIILEFSPVYSSIRNLHMKQ